MAGARTPVLVTADDYYAALAGVRGLAAGGFAPWVATDAPRGFAARSRAAAGVLEVPDPTGDADSYVAALARAADVAGVEAVLPGTEPTLVVLAGRGDELGGARLGAPPPDVVARATDKDALEAAAAAAGAVTPPTAIVARGETGGELEYPAIVKPVRTALPSADGTIERRMFARRVETPHELADVLRTAPGERWLVQPFLDGDLEAVGGVAWEGRVVCAQRQVARRVWPPRTGGSSFAVTVAEDEPLSEVVGRLVAELRWSGLFQAQFIRSGGTPHLIDFNPRMWGSLGLALAAGQNLPAVWADLVLGREPVVGSYRVGVGFRAETKDVRAIVRDVRQGRWRAAGELLPRRGTTHAIGTLRDPAPLLALAGQLRHARRSPTLGRRR